MLQLGGDFDQELIYLRDQYEKWKVENKLYFSEGVIEALPDLFELPGRVPEEVAHELIERFGIKHLNNEPFTRTQLVDGEVRFGNSDVLDGKLALALHFAYAKPKAPDFVWENDLKYFSDWKSLSDPKGAPPDTSTAALRQRLMGALLSYDLPILKCRSPEEVLELRAKYTEQRQGFGLALNELADDVEKRLGHGEDQAAQRTIERIFVPKFEQVRRRWEQQNRGTWAKIGEGIAGIEAIPPSPKFFFQFAKALFGLAGKLSEHEVSMGDNQTQAFRLLARVIQVNGN